MLLLGVGELVDEALLQGGEAGDLGSAVDGTGSSGAGDVGRGETRTGGGPEVKLGFEVFEVQREVEDIGVGIRRGRGRGNGAVVRASRDYGRSA